MKPKNRIKNRVRIKTIKKQSVLLSLLCPALLFGGCSQSSKASQETGNQTAPGNITDKTIAEGNLRRIVYALVSSAENSTLDYWDQYGYIEDIEDGRGYTAGIIGFTSGTGDLIEVIEAFDLRQPSNTLQAFLPTLEAVNGSDSHEGLGDDFEAAWKSYGRDADMAKAQNEIVDKYYLDPAVEDAKEDGLSALGQYIYYDAMVVHGPGDDEDSFGGIRAAALKKAAPPADGGDESSYLLAFLSVRTEIMLKEEAHSDLSRIEAQKKFIEEQNWNLDLPLQWTMYGDEFFLDEEQVNSMPDIET